MDLEAFIEGTLIAVCNGIKNAKEKLNTNNAIIAPGRVEGQNVTELRYIDFEVLVTVNNKNQLQVDGGASGKVNVGIGKGEASLNAVTTRSSHEASKNRICFSVPYLPEGIGYRKKQN